MIDLQPKHTCNVLWNSIIDHRICFLLSHILVLPFTYLSLVLSTILIPIVFILQVNAEQKLINALSIQESYDTVSCYIIILTLSKIIYEMSWRMYDFLKMKFSAQIRINVFQDFVSRIMEKDYKFFNLYSDATIAHASKQISDAAEKLLIISVKFIGYASLTVAAVYKMNKISIYCGFVVFIYVAVWIILSTYLIYRLSTRIMQHARASNMLVSVFSDTLANIDIVNALRAQEYEKKRIYRSSSLLKQREIDVNIVLWYVWTIQSIVFAILFLIIIRNTILSYNPTVRAGAYIICGQIMLQLCNTMWSCSEDIAKYIEERGKLDYGLKIIEYDHLNEAPSFPHPIKIGNNLCKQAIVCNDVSFQYDNNQKFKFNCSFEKNKCTVIVGKSGVGKTTLIKLILDVIKPHSGSIYRSSNNIAYVPQNPRLFDSTLEYNICYHALHNEQEIDVKLMNKSLRLTNLDIKYNSFINDKKISGGQKQKIMIARAIYSEADIIILDEPTSALDTSSIENILSTLKSLQNMTRIVVSHTHNMLSIAENIIILDQRQIIFNGTVAEAKSAGLYEKFVCQP